MMSASIGVSTKETMSRGGWNSVAMVVRYEHASEERYALLAQAFIPTQNRRLGGQPYRTDARQFTGC